MTEQGQKPWIDKMIKIGIITMSLAAVVNFGPPLYLWLGLGIIPPFEDIMKIWLVATTAFGIGWVIQPVSFFSILGTSSSYIAWFAGSVADIRVPSVTMAQRVTGIEPGTPEGEIITTIAVAGSVLVSVTIITVFTLIGATVVPLLPKFIINSFNYVLPAVFGGVYMEMSSNNLKVGALSAVAAVILTIGAKTFLLPAWLLTILCISGGIIAARFVYQQQLAREKIL